MGYQTDKFLINFDGTFEDLCNVLTDVGFEITITTLKNKDDTQPIITIEKTPTHTSMDSSRSYGKGEVECGKDKRRS